MGVGVGRWVGGGRGWKVDSLLDCFTRLKQRPDPVRQKPDEDHAAYYPEITAI